MLFIKKNISLQYISILLYAITISCGKDSGVELAPRVFEGVYLQKEHVGRPAIKTIFLNDKEKNTFNTTLPSEMNNLFKDKFKIVLNTLNDGTYSTNILNLNVDAFANILATDVLNINTTTPETTFYELPNVFTGRKLTDDVIDIELLFIFGGADGNQNPNLISDHIDTNDVDFLPYFPYLAPPHID